MQPDARGQAMPAPTVTLLVDPEQAETLTLAGSDGKIQLVLRNSSDQTVEKTMGRYVTELYTGAASAAPVKPRRAGGSQAESSGGRGSAASRCSARAAASAGSDRRDPRERANRGNIPNGPKTN